jgi:type VI secretion system secreted protein Hcp
MALGAYLRLAGQKQGEIKGSVIQKGREGKILVIAMSHEVVSPRDAASGQATGRRQHKALVVTKELDKSSPLLHQAQANNESFKEWELQFWAPNLKAGAAGAGTEVQHFTIKLSNAAISSITMQMPNIKDPELTRFETFEEVAFVYQKIEWTWLDGNITALDDWETQVA